MQRQPSLFIPHGAGPCFHMKGLVGPPGTWDGMEAFLRGLRTQFPEVPRALLLVTSHWETDVVTVSTKAHPGLFHDWFDEGRRLPPELVHALRKSGSDWRRWLLPSLSLRQAFGGWVQKRNLPQLRARLQ